MTEADNYILDAIMQLGFVPDDNCENYTGTEQQFLDLVKRARKQGQDDVHSQIKTIYDAVEPHWFLDPPVGGDVKLHEGVKRIEDAVKAANARIDRLKELVEEAYAEGFQEGKDGGWNTGYDYPWKTSDARAALEGGKST